ncbi:uncharacterized protein K489DRAFT_31237 [Dissoconium aciculare CBS 342.82]|uniref:Fibroin-3 related protein n=1 Tax=Dissoconium aciculare CBS 342.82 TaxID=1314786 RepID=A0A6J3MJG7_9PEZI|nr:uncharacterized protein K489DRAFT_31237 [Dissoconium aciculare CBS 342.82]KAF1827894.1 hypothetical protein K489DRAFT_31237 [Dissoconium aciculare CBS 342.82]
MATTSIRQRDVGSSISDVKTTYSSWDTCMEKSYCKWPAIIGIVVASLIVISLLTCLFRCLCCGVECCCACFKCCNACCPSPRRRGGREGYQQTPAPLPPAQPFPTRDQYVQKLSMQYGSGAPAVARTATFDTPSRARTTVSTTSHNDDALPAMPSWDAAREKRIEASAEEHPEEMEMTRLKSPRVQSPSTQQSQTLPRRENASPYGENFNHPAPAAYPVRRQGDDNFANHRTPISPVASPHQDLASSGDVGTLSAAPYHEYSRGGQFAPSPYSSQRTTDNPPPMYAAHNPTNVAVAMPYSSTDSRVEPAQYGHDGRQQQRNQYQQDGYGSRAQQPQYGQGGYNSGPRQPQSPQDEYGSGPQQPQYGQGSYGSRPQQPQPQQGGYDGRPQQPRPQQGGYDSRPQQPQPQQRWIR